jgi:hypothetical protein
MRVPVDSEASAFRAVLLSIAVAALSVGLGYLVGSAAGSTLVGVALFGVVMLAALLVASARKRGDMPIRDAERQGDARNPRPRILLVAGAVPSDEQLRHLRQSAPHAVVDVHAPVLQSRAHFATTDVDGEIEASRRRLHATLTRAFGAGIHATGEVGDAIDPLAGIQDELRRHHIDRVVFAAHAAVEENWLEAELLEQMQTQLSKPVQVLEAE